MKRIPAGCVAPAMLGLGVALLTGSFFVSMAETFWSYNGGKGLDDVGNHPAPHAGLWTALMGIGGLLLVGGVLLGLGQLVLWLWRKVGGPR